MDKKEVRLPAPLFRDPIYDCPTDPAMIWNQEEKMWYLFYTQRRASQVYEGVSWVHGTKIGVAVSTDGARWLYRGTLEGLDIERGHNTFWAPEIFRAEGMYHMFVSYITGIPTDWEYPRRILHYTSGNLWDWNYEGQADLNSERVIDACVYEIAPHLYKMWYKDESNGSMTSAAISEDLNTWKVLGAEITDCAQEGPNVFELGGIKWLISDYWHGLAVYKSEDFTHWMRCPDILQDTGSRRMDKGEGHHADVVVRDGRAFIFYFCHPNLPDHGMNQPDDARIMEQLQPQERCRAVVQAAELLVKDGIIYCDRNAEVSWPAAVI